MRKGWSVRPLVVGHVHITVTARLGEWFLPNLMDSLCSEAFWVCSSVIKTAGPRLFPTEINLLKKSVSMQTIEYYSWGRDRFWGWGCSSHARYRLGLLISLSRSPLVVLGQDPGSKKEKTAPIPPRGVGEALDPQALSPGKKKRSHPVWYHLYNILEITQLETYRCGEEVSDCRAYDGSWGDIKGWHEAALWWWNSSLS